MADDFGMTLDELNRRFEEKRARIDANVEALEQAYVDHEDFIADFDAFIERLERAGLIVDEAKQLRDRAYVFLLGPLAGGDDVTEFSA